MILKDGFHLTFSRCFWSTYIDGDQYDVDLHIRGETDADEITIDSYGDGVGYPRSIEIKKKEVLKGLSIFVSEENECLILIFIQHILLFTRKEKLKGS